MAGKPNRSGVRSLLISSAATLAIIGGMQNAIALTGAGQRIQNQATATYKDALGNDYTAQSNLASVEVKQVFFATLESDSTKTVASNQTAYFQHILTNTGNGTDTYTVGVAQDTSAGGDTGDFSSLKVYIDANDNGVVDAGELEVTSVTLEAGKQVSLVVAGLVPTATDGDTFGATLTVSTPNGAVTDLTAGKGIDGADDTNENVATVSGDAILNAFKSSIHDEANNEITYTLTVTNTGNTDARDVAIFDGLPAGTTLVPGSVTGSGFGTAIDTADLNAASGVLSETGLNFVMNGDGLTDDATESALGIDLNTDGTIDGTSVSGVYGFDDVLEPGATVELSFKVSYDPDGLGAGELIENRFYVAGDLDGSGSVDNGFIPSTLTTDIVPQSYAVTVTDTGTGAGAGVNDGGDDDAANGTQLVDSAQAGELVIFTHVITNTGNGTDTFELNIDNQTNFPPGTVFTIWSEDGSVQLLNTNGEGGVDTGPMDQGDVLRVQVRAQLPSSGTATNATYDLVATSSADPSSSPTSDSTEGRLASIAAPTVDLSNTASDNDANTNQDAYSNNAVPVTTRTANPGDTVSFDLFIQNDSQVADSFQLASGGSVGAGQVLGSLPTGWTVTFRDASGSVITTTPSIAPGGELQISADVSIPNTETLALADRTFVVDTAGNDTVDGNSDSDGDYGIFFQARSVNSGAVDTKLDAVDVLPNEELTLLQNNGGQIQPGGSIDYPHTLTNDGNTTEALTFSAVNSTANWSNNLLVDTDGVDGPDTPFASLPANGTIYYFDASGTLTAGTLSGGTLSLEPGESLSFIVRAFAPTSAPNGQLDTITVSANYNGGADSVTNLDRSEVVESQLRLVKTASVDADCSDVGLADLGPDSGFTETAGRAEPTDCVVWQVVATNAGVDTITDVSITDTVPAFSIFRSGSLRICEGDAGQGQAAVCTFSSLTDASGDDEGTWSGSNLSIELGEGTSPELATLTEVVSGASVTVRFATEVE